MKLPVPDSVLLKEPNEFTLIGHEVKRLDGPEKVTGRAIFGMDVSLPNMLVACVSRCPVFEGKVKGFKANEALKIKGVVKVLQISNGVAVIANDFWTAKRGRDALSIDWDLGPHASMNSDQLLEGYKQAISKPGVDVTNQGDTAAAFKTAVKTLEADYIAPYQAHACMEPMNATADVQAKTCHVYAPTQAQTSTQNIAMKLTGLPREKVFVHTTFLGGGFGRRSEIDFITDALECSKAMKRPVKVIWTREDDMMHDYYRPFSYNHFKGGLDKDGNIVVWDHRIACSSILARRFPSAGVNTGRDRTSVEGAANLPYHIANLKVNYNMVNTGVPVGFWRSVGSSQNAYVTECFLDELAHLAGKDPLAVRLALAKDHPRHTGVLKLAADKANWHSKLPQGRARGIAVAESFGSYVAQVAEVSIDRGKVRVHKVVCAIDCGVVVNPNIIRAQMESGIVYGLTATLKSQITLKQGRVQETNFDSFPLLRFDECPEIEVYLVKSEENPGGVGEPGTPPIAPAVANAVMALTKKPVRSLPIRL